MSPVFLVSVIDFIMSSALDTAHDGVAFFPQTFSNSWSNCVGMDIFLTDTPMHSWSLSTLLLPASHALVVCSLGVVVPWGVFFCSGMVGGEMRFKFSCVVSSIL